MAPVEPARVAAVAVVATTGIILAALAIAKLTSNSKKQPKDKSSDSPAEGDARETTPSGSRSNGVHKENNSKSNHNDEQNKTDLSSSLTESSQIGSRPSNETPKQLPESTRVLRNNGRTHEKDTKPRATKIPRAKSTEKKGPLSSASDTVDSGLLVQQVFKSKTEPEEQTIVSFAEIHFSPGSTPEKEENVPKVTTVKTGLRSSPERGSENLAAASPKRSSQISPEKETKSGTDSLDSSSFEVISVSSKKGESRKKTSPEKVSSSLPTKSGVMQTSFEEDFDPHEGAGESLAESVETSDNGSSVLNTGSLEGGGDGSFVLLDVATAPSNCKPDMNLVESPIPDQSDLQQTVSLQRLKSSSSDSGETTAAPDSPQGDADPYPNLSDDDIRETLNVASVNPENLEMRHSQTLVKMLFTNDFDLQEKLLAVIAKVAAFTKNQNCLRKSGCIPRLTHLLKNYCVAGGSALPPTALMNALINAVTNLAVNTTNNTLMKECVAPLVDLSLSSSVSESVQMSSLQALTNLSVTSDHHQHYTRLVQRLFDLVDSDITNAQLQTLKVLVNLSCNKEMVPTLLAAKACRNLFFLLEMKTSESLVLRWSTLLANIMHTVKERQLTSTELPPVEKAASPETMYSALYGLNTSGQLRNKVFVLSKHPNEDIRYQAARIYSGLTKQSTV